jgi:HK97 family phage major capsid protein
MAKTVADQINEISTTLDTRLSALETENKALKVENKSLTERVDKIAKTPVYPGGLSPDKVFATARDEKEEGQCGFYSYGHQLKFIADEKRGVRVSPDDVKRQEAVYKCINERMVKKGGQGLQEASGSDGGHLLAPTWAEGVLEVVYEQENLLDKCDKYDMVGPSIKIRAYDETSRVTGSRRGGVRGYWVDEGGTITSSKPKFRVIELIPHKLAVLSYATEELLADGGQMLEQMVTRCAAEEINFLVADAIINGVGAGMPLGLMNSAALVSVSAETGQATKTVLTENVTKMWARLHMAARKNAVWFINQDIEPQLHLMTLGVGTGGVVTYMPPGGLSSPHYATLLGRPVITIEQCQTLGTTGDIILADLKQVVAATRGTVQAATSLHVAFLTDELAYRFTFRVDAKPWWYSAMTPYKGTNTQAPYVALSTR